MILSSLTLRRDDPIIADFNTLPDYDFHNVPRVGRKGGGVCVCLRKSFKVHTTDRKSFELFEYIDLAITSRSLRPLRLIIIYTKEKQRTALIFLRAFSTFYEAIATLPAYLLIAVDFNFHMDNLSVNREAALFADLSTHLFLVTLISAIVFYMAFLTLLQSCKEFKIRLQGLFPGLAHAITLRLCFTNFTGFLLNFASCTKFFSLITSVFMDLLLITLLNQSRNINQVAVYVIHLKLILLLLQFLLVHMVRDLFIMLLLNFGTLCLCISKTQRLLNNSNPLLKTYLFTIAFGNN